MGSCLPQLSAPGVLPLFEVDRAGSALCPSLGCRRVCFILRVEEIVLTSMLEEALPDSGFYSRFPFTFHSFLSSLTAPPHPRPLQGGFRFSACPWAAHHLSGTGQGVREAVSVWFGAQGDEHWDRSSGPAGPFRPNSTGGGGGDGGEGDIFHEVWLFHSTKGGDV